MTNFVDFIPYISERKIIVPTYIFFPFKQEDLEPHFAGKNNYLRIKTRQKPKKGKLKQFSRYGLKNQNIMRKIKFFLFWMIFCIYMIRYLKLTDTDHCS